MTKQGNKQRVKCTPVCCGGTSLGRGEVKEKVNTYEDGRGGAGHCGVGGQSGGAGKEENDNNKEVVNGALEEEEEGCITEGDTEWKGGAGNCRNRRFEELEGANSRYAEKEERDVHNTEERGAV